MMKFSRFEILLSLLLLVSVIHLVSTVMEKFF